MSDTTSRSTEGRTSLRGGLVVATVAAVLVFALTPLGAFAAGTLPDGGAGDATAAPPEQAAAQQASAAQSEGETIEVSFLVPVYKTNGTPESGVREWVIETKKCTKVTSSDTDWTDENATGGWYVVVGDVSLDGTFWCNGSINLVLADGCSLKAHGDTDKAGIRVTGSDSLTIYSQSQGDSMGSLEARGGYDGAGIGGGNDGDGCNITICGGTITATGGAFGAGIGGGSGANGHDITIAGGNVAATGGCNAAGIGGGVADGCLLWTSDGVGRNILIVGGDVTASGTDGGAGIGGGGEADGHDITIAGGTVKASSSNAGAGIGGGTCEDGYDIAISGGTVTATGGSYAAGIGGGHNGEGGRIAISDGTVTATGGNYAAGIGGGDEAKGHHLSVTGGNIAATGSGGGSGIGGGKGAGSEEVTVAEVVALYYGDDGKSWTALASDKREVDASGTLDPAHYVVTSRRFAWETQEGTPVEGEPGRATYAVRASNPAIEVQQGVTGVVWEEEEPQGVTWSIEDGRVVATTSEATAAGDYPFHLYIDCANVGANELEVTKPIAYDVPYIDEDSALKTCPQALEVGPARLQLDDSGVTRGWYVLDRDLEVDGTITSVGNVHLILADGCSLRATGAGGMPGVRVTEGSLTIHAQSTGDAAGSIIAAGGTGAAGIGGAEGEIGCNITFCGGRIEAQGGLGGAGIGGGRGAVGARIWIIDGEVDALGGYNAAGIGGGWADGSSVAESWDIRVYSGTVTAKASGGGAGIGGGMHGDCSSVLIFGGEVTATAADGGAGIGGGDADPGSSCDCPGGRARGNINITGGKVCAQGRNGGAGIGGGNGGSAKGISVTGGEVSAEARNGGAGIGCGRGSAEAARRIEVAPELTVRFSTDGQSWTTVTDSQKSDDLASILAGMRFFFASSDAVDEQPTTSAQDVPAAASITPVTALDDSTVSSTSLATSADSSPEGSQDSSKPADQQACSEGSQDSSKSSAPSGSSGNVSDPASVTPVTPVSGSDDSSADPTDPADSADPADPSPADPQDPPESGDLQDPQSSSGDQQDPQSSSEDQQAPSEPSVPVVSSSSTA